MFGVKCKQCNKKYTSEYINIITGICVYCENNTNEFYINGDLVMKQEAIDQNKEMENLEKQNALQLQRLRKEDKTLW